MQYTYVKVKSPATLANFGPGFDVFGVALDLPYDIVEMERTDGPSSVKTLNHKVPDTLNRNVASYAALQILQKHAPDVNFKMTVTKGIRPASGMGSSGASSVGGAYAAAALIDNISDEDIVLAAAEGERISSGNAHADNVAPCYFGGFTSIVSLSPFNVLNIMPNDLKILTVLPDVKVSTKKARAILPKNVPMKDAIQNVSMSAYVIYSLMKGEYENLRVALNDALSVPYRKTLLPGYDKARAAALNAGALAFSLGGSGPTVFAIYEDDGKAIAKAIKEAFLTEGIESSHYITKIGGGAEIVSLE